MINVLQPSCSEAEINAVSAVLRSGWWGMGPKCEEFEHALAQRYGKRYCITVNSATAGLHLTLLAMGIGPGDEVIVPALTFVSTALAVKQCGATPVFCDVLADSLTLDWQAASRLVENETKAIIPVDFAGYPAGRGSAFPVVQDAAHSCGGTAYGDAVVLSFHPVKPLATPDGGAVLTNDADLAEKMRALRWCGIDKSTWARSGKRYSWDYCIGSLGYKYHWNDVAASIGLAQFHRLPAMQARRRQIAERYTSELAGLCQLPKDHPSHTWHLYTIRVEAERRDSILDLMAAKGIGCGVHYRPVNHYLPYVSQGLLPVTEREWLRLISLPIHNELSDEQQGQVIAALREVL